jgi:hypothetical protein
MRIRLLLDENLAPLLKSALLRLDPTIDVVRVGDADAPPFHTLDPDILAFCEAEQRLLVTGNRKACRRICKSIGHQEVIFGDYAGYDQARLWLTL